MVIEYLHIATMDIQVSRSKFEDDTKKLKDLESTFGMLRGWRIKLASYPALTIVLRHNKSKREIEFRFLCDDWDDIPPSLTLHDSLSGEELRWDDWPKGAWATGNQHPETGKPFLCLPGIREYHTHTSHRNDFWSGYIIKGSYRLRHIVDRVAQRFQETDG